MIIFFFITRNKDVRLFNFLLADQNFIYTTALAIVLGISLLEGIGILLGMSLFAALDNLFDFDIDLDADADLSSGGITSVLGWLCIDRLPLLVWLILLLTSFGVLGLSLNWLAGSWQADYATSLTVTLVSVATLICTHYLGNGLAKIFPKNESSALSSRDFVGQVATITLGTAAKGKAAEAMFQDEHHQKHYVMVEPEQDVKLVQGTRVVLLEKTASIWLVIEFTPL